MNEPTKICTKCRELKPLSSFAKAKKHKDGLKYNCKECDKIYRGTRLKLFDYQRSWNLKSRYGLTVQDYNRMYDRQKGCCAICGKHQSEFQKSLMVDHDHKTGKIRGLLCSDCNRGLGFFKDSRGCLIRAIQYLKKYK